MNTKSLTAALILSLAALSSAHAADAPRADRIVDLPTITVRPDAALRAELAAERAQALTAQLAARLVAQATMSAHLR